MTTLRTAHVVVTLDSVVLPLVMARARELRNGRPVHYLTRTLLGSPGNVFQMPLCWDAETHQRHGRDCDDAAWWLSVDQGALVLHEHVGTYDRELITCRDCIEWLRA